MLARDGARNVPCSCAGGPDHRRRVVTALSTTARTARSSSSVTDTNLILWDAKDMSQEPAGFLPRSRPIEARSLQRMSAPDSCGTSDPLEIRALKLELARPIVALASALRSIPADMAPVAQATQGALREQLNFGYEVPLARARKERFLLGKYETSGRCKRPNLRVVER